jgi:molybdate transport system substrate-binding protein
MKKQAVICILSLLLSLGTAWPALAGEITVSAAASLTNAFTEIKDAFEKKHPNVRVVTNFASSNALLSQIESGAPVDVFASADQATMDRAASKSLIDAPSRRNFAVNGLVLIAPSASALNLKKAEDLGGSAVQRIALGNPESVPAGRYAREALEIKGLWNGLQAKFVYGENVRQVLDYVSRAEVEAGFVYSTDAKQAGEKVRVVETLSGKTPVTYPIAVLSASRNKKDAQSFASFVYGPEGLNILARYGFSKP